MWKKLWVAGEYILLLAVPTFLMQDIRVLAYRPLIMGLTIVYIALIAWRERYNLAMLGVQHTNLPTALRRLLPSSVLLVAGITLGVYLLPRPVVISLLGADGLSFPLVPRLLMYIFASVPVQEMIYRGYLMLRLEIMGLSSVVSGILAVLAFTLGHVPFQSPLMLGVALVLGVMYLSSYRRDHNLLALCVSHAFIGASLMLVRNSLVPF